MSRKPLSMKARKKEDRRQSWDRRLPERRLAPDEFVFREGERAEFGYVVASGKISICKQIEGQYVELAEIVEGEMFGEMALIDKGVRSAAAQAKEDTVLREVDTQALMLYMSRSPQTAQDLMQRLVSYARGANEALDRGVLNASMASAPDENQESNSASTHLSNMESLSQESADNEEIINDFQNPEEALLKRRLPRSMRMVFLTIFLLVVSLLTWASFSVIDVTLAVQGKLSTSTPLISVQSGDSSVVKEAKVKLGQEVKKGDVLATLDPTINDADFKQKNDEYTQLGQELQRLRLERDNAPDSAYTQLNSLLHQDIFRSRWSEYRARIASLELAISRAQSMYSVEEGRLVDSKLALEEARFKYATQKRLVAENIVHSKALKEALFVVRRSQNEVDKGQVSLKIADTDLKVAVQEKESYLSTRFKQLDEEFSSASQRYDGLHEELIKIQHRRKNVHILAPVDGIILEAERLYSGARVAPGDVVAKLVPTNVPLTVNLDVDPRSISNIVVGQDVSVKLSALPYQKHSDLSATVSYISEDTVATSVNGESGTYFRVKAKIESNNLVDLPQGFRLIPGIQVQGDVKTGKRRLITYFLYPIIRTLDTSFVEP